MNVEREMDSRDYECIDPHLGDELWRLDDAGTEPALRERLEAHAEFCAACAERRAVAASVASALAAGECTLPARRRRRPARVVGAAGAFALAAGLALLALLPPEAPPSTLVRGDGSEARVERPVPGELVATRTPSLRWSAIEGATAYEVRVSEVGGDYAWSTRTEEAQVRIPAEEPLPRPARLRATIEVVPSYLTPALGVDTTFRTGSFGELLLYRLRSGALGGRALFWTGLGLLLVTVVVLRPRRRSA